MSKRPKVTIVAPSTVAGDGPPGYLGDLEKVLDMIVPAQAWDNFEQWQTDLPFVQWSELQDDQGWFRVHLLCPHHDSNHAHSFFIEMMRRWLVSGERQPILSARQWIFRFETGVEDYYLGELLLAVSRGKDGPEVRKNLPLLVPELRLGAISPPHARRLLETKGVEVSKKASHLHESLVAVMRRQPNLVRPEIIDDVQHFLLLCGESFRDIRSVRHLRRIIYSLYLARDSLRKELGLRPGWRHFHTRIMRAKLEYVFGEKPVLGIAIAVNALPTYEVLEADHILRAVAQVGPEIRVVERSFFAYQLPDDPIRCIYVEVERHDRQPVTGEELDRLRAELATELKGRVERLTHSVFNPPNEENVYRSIMALGREIRYVRDIPQVSISFQGQDRMSLTFSVIMVRVWKEDSQSVEELTSKLPHGVVCKVQDEVEAGLLRKRYVKRASVFSISLEKERFLRRDAAVDLGRARQFVVQCLNQMFGDVRDFNGGLIDKQSEVLESAKGLLNTDERREEFLLENLFYALTPPVMQSYLEPSVVKLLLDLILSLGQQDLPSRGGAALEHRQLPGGAYLLVACANHKSFYSEVQKAVEELSVDPLHLASALLPAQGLYFLCYVHLHDDEVARQELRTTVERALSGWQQQQRSRQCLRLNLTRAIHSLDPRIGSDRRSGILMKMLYEGLTRLDASGKPTLAAAESVHLSEDKRTYTFTLRSTRWTNGELITAHDFEYAWKIVMAPDFKSRYSFFDIIKGGKAAKEGTRSIDEVGIRVVDDRTLEVKLEHPAPYFLELVAHWTYLPLYRGIDKKRPGWASSKGEDYVCNGPFRLSEDRRREVVRLVKNASYWDAPSVRLDQIEIAQIDDPQTALNLYEQGQLDWIGEPLCELPNDAIPRLQTAGLLQKTPAAALYRYEFNVELSPFKNKKIRKALAYAINRKKLVEEVLQSGERPARGLFPHTVRLTRVSLLPDGDVERARRFFEEGLRELGMSREEFPPITISHIYLQEQDRVAKAVAKQWEEALGITVVTEGFEWKTFADHILSNDYQVAGITWYSWLRDPIYNLAPFRHRHGVFNVSRWESAEYQRVLDEADEAVNLHVREMRLMQAEALLMDEIPCTPLYYYSYTYVRRPEVHGVVVSEVGQTDFKWAYVAEEEK